MPNILSNWVYYETTKNIKQPILSTDQLHEIRKTNMARFACDNAEGIKYIQPEAFMSVRPGYVLYIYSKLYNSVPISIFYFKLK